MGESKHKGGECFMRAKVEKVFDALGIEETPVKGMQYSAKCPAHDDQKASLSVLVDEGNITLNCHAGCSYDQILKAAGLVREDMLLEPVPITVERLAEDKGLPASYLESLGVKTVGDEVRIIYYKHDGEPASRHRRRTALKASGGSKWTAGTGSPICYGDWLLKEGNHSYQVFVEGESDCWTLWYYKLPAIGVPGANHANKITQRHIKGKDRVYIWQEPDAAGKKFVDGVVNRLYDLGYEGEVYSIRGLDGEKDPNELHKQSEDFLAKWQEILAEAKPEELAPRNVVSLEAIKGGKKSQPGIVIENGRYRKKVYLKGEDTWIWADLSNFYFNVKEELITEDGKTLWVVDIHGDNLKQPLKNTIESKDLSNKQALLRWLPQGLTWYGNNQDIDHLRDYLGREAKEAPTKKALTRWGRHDDVLVYPSFVIDKDGKVEEPEVALISAGDEGWLREPEDIEWNQEEAQRIVQYLPYFNSEDVVGLVLGWTFATPWRRHFVKFPQFSFASGAGSGKTTTALLMANLGGNMIEDTASAQQTKFMLTRQMASTTTLPIVLDEFKPGEMNDVTLRGLLDLLKLNYDSGYTGRGRADQSIVNYQLTAPVIILGEGSVDQTAIIDRAVRPSLSRRRLEENPEYQRAYRELRKCNLGMFAVKYQQWALTQEPDLEAVEMPELTTSLRAIYNHRIVKFGWMMLKKFCREVVGKELPDLDIDKAIIASLENLGYLEVRDGEILQKKTRSDVDTLMEAIHDATVNGVITPGVHWVKRPKEGDVIIRIGSVLDKLKKTDAKVLSQRDYKRMIEMGDCSYAEWNRSKQAKFLRAVDSLEIIKTRGPLVIDPVKLERETDIPAEFWDTKDGIVD